MFSQFIKKKIIIALLEVKITISMMFLLLVHWRYGICKAYL